MAITQNLSIGDEGIYICTFEAFPDIFDIEYSNSAHSIECTKADAIKLIQLLKNHYNLSGQQFELDLTGGIG